MCPPLRFPPDPPWLRLTPLRSSPEVHLRDLRSTAYLCHSQAFSQSSESQPGSISIAAVGPPSPQPERNGSSHPRFATFNGTLTIPTNDLHQVSGPTHNNPYFMLGSSTEATLDAIPYIVEPFVPEVTPENGYRSLLPEDGIPGLRNTLASCGQLMISLR